MERRSSFLHGVRLHDIAAIPVLQIQPAERQILVAKEFKSFFE